MPLDCRSLHTSTLYNSNHTPSAFNLGTYPVPHNPGRHGTVAPGTTIQLPLSGRLTNELVWGKADALLSCVLRLGPKKLDLVTLSLRPALKVSVSFLHLLTPRCNLALSHRKIWPWLYSPWSWASRTPVPDLSLRILNFGIPSSQFLKFTFNFLFEIILQFPSHPLTSKHRVDQMSWIHTLGITLKPCVRF